MSGRGHLAACMTSIAMTVGLLVGLRWLVSPWNCGQPRVSLYNATAMKVGNVRIKSVLRAGGYDKYERTMTLDNVQPGEYIDIYDVPSTPYVEVYLSAIMENKVEVCFNMTYDYDDLECILLILDRDSIVYVVTHKADPRWAATVSKVKHE